MKIAYFDCYAGASGDMILGSLLDAGLDLEALKTELSKIPVHEYAVRAHKLVKKGITATKFDVDLLHPAKEGHSHAQGDHSHAHRHLGDILHILEHSTLDNDVQKKSARIFTRLAEAEAKIHGKSVQEIHFHEVGAVDAIVDIAGAVSAMNLLGIDKIFASRINTGTGTVECAHGTLLVPAPATLELLKGIPVYSTGIEAELITPTGAAILTTLAESFGPMPGMSVESIGYGAGFRDLPVANVLRVSIGRAGSGDEDIVQLLETNIDDMNPQFYDHVMDSLFSAGAKDVFLHPIIMKKSRPGIVLSVIVEPDRLQACTNVLFRETTTLGVRISDVKKRQILSREIKSVDTQWGPARVKIRHTAGGSPEAVPEYDDCRRIAREKGIPIREVYDAVKRQAEKIKG
ncbi:nickel pincer cofactor biosynthesis protein LarC [bacterium]|nr:nickel pincer cofactor biosynthesis protein LarC [bacterium]